MALRFKRYFPLTKINDVMASCGFKEKASIENKYPYPADSPSRKQMKTETKKRGGGGTNPCG